MDDIKIILSAKGLVKKIDDNEILSGIDIEIKKGSFTVIMGPSGSGKSTLLYALSGMDQATEGTVYFKDKDITNLKVDELTKLHGNDFGFIFQSSRLVKNLSLYENVLISGLLCKGKREEDVKKETLELLNDVGLMEAKDRFPSAVSGGEAQRAAVARAVIKEPEVLFADEPTGALNKANSLEVMRLLSEQNKRGRTTLLVTHDREAAIYGTDILYLEDGKIKSEIELPVYNGKDVDRESAFLRWLDEQRW